MGAPLPTRGITLRGHLPPGPPRSAQVVASPGDFEGVSKVVKEVISLASVRQWREE